MFSGFNSIYFLTNITYYRNGLRDFSITLYNETSEWLLVGMHHTKRLEEDQHKRPNRLCGTA
jgi:hypothetical protein